MKSKRHESIIHFLKTTSYASVNELADTLFFSRPTIRRDLAELEKKGIIIRSHGGASLKNTPNTSVAFDLRTTLQTKEKTLIAKQAVDLINDGDVVFLDASTTVLHMLKFLSGKKNLTIVTNSLQVPLLLRNEEMSVYTTGGKLIPNSLAYGGPIAEQTIDSFHIDKLFFSSYALTKSGEIQDYSDLETSLRKKLLQKCQKKYFLCDSSKFGRTSVFQVANLDELDGILSDIPCPF